MTEWLGNLSTLQNFLVNDLACSWAPIEKDESLTGIELHPLPRKGLLELLGLKETTLHIAYLPAFNISHVSGVLGLFLPGPGLTGFRSIMNQFEQITSLIDLHIGVYPVILQCWSLCWWCCIIVYSGLKSLLRIRVAWSIYHVSTLLMSLHPLCRGPTSFLVVIKLVPNRSLPCL